MNNKNAKTSERPPVLFIGHGSPMNAIEENSFTRSLTETGKKLPQFKAVCVISAHWLSRSSFVSSAARPETIYDFYGFPDELYQVSYPAPGSPESAERVHSLFPEIQLDGKRGLDHGAWSILRHLFPDADVPVFQLSIDFDKPLTYHFDLAEKLKPLRDEGILFIGSGNIVHNLSLVQFDKNAKPYVWAEEFDEWVHGKVESHDYKSLIKYEHAGKSAALSVPTADHYIPLLYTLGLADKTDNAQIIYSGIDLATISMRSYLF